MIRLIKAMDIVKVKVIKNVFTKFNNKKYVKIYMVEKINS